jgi:osmotically-inducible protein OsmY
LNGHIKQSLAQDERTNMLDVVVDVRGRDVILLGNVSCEQRRALAEQVVCELVSEPMRVINSLRIERYGEPTAAEALD